LPATLNDINFIAFPHVCIACACALPARTIRRREKACNRNPAGSHRAGRS